MKSIRGVVSVLTTFLLGRPAQAWFRPPQHTSLNRQTQPFNGRVVAPSSTATITPPSSASATTTHVEIPSPTTVSSSPASSPNNFPGITVRQGFSDFRSDTVTKPTQQMRKAMSKAEVGDDVYREDPTVDQLEREVAAMMGHESALFVPSRTMGNLISLMIWCSKRGSSFICGEKSHIFLCEEGGAAQFGGVSPYPVPNEPDGSLSIENIRKAIMEENDATVAELITLENPVDRCGGVVLPLSYIQSVSQLARENNLKLHLDGSRIWNAATAHGVNVKEIAKHADSVTVCISKGLGAPAGSLLVGSREFTEKARKMRKALGGAMRQVGVLAAAGLVGIKRTYPRLIEDHDNAKRLAAAAATIPGLKINLPGVQTNVVMMDLDERLNMTSSELVEELEKRGVLALGVGPRRIRMVTHYDVSETDVKKAVHALEKVLQPLKELVPPIMVEQPPAAAAASTSPAAATPTQQDQQQQRSNAEGLRRGEGGVHGPSSSSSSLGLDLDHLPEAFPPSIIDTTATTVLVNVTSSAAAQAAEAESPIIATTPVEEAREMMLHGVSTSVNGFVVVLAQPPQDCSAPRRALKVLITPSDPMSTGLDVHQAETPEAVTILQLLQDIDVGSHLKHDALATLVGLRAGHPVSLKRAIIEQVSADNKKCFKARLEIAVEDDGASSDPAYRNETIGSVASAAPTKPVYAEVKSPFQAMALAFRYGAKLAATSNLLEDASVSMDICQVRAAFPELLELKPGMKQSPSAVPLDLDTEYEIGRLEKQLQAAMEEGNEQAVQKIRRQLSLYAVDVREDTPMPLLQQEASVTPYSTSYGQHDQHQQQQQAARQEQQVVRAPTIVPPPANLSDLIDS